MLNIRVFSTILISQLVSTLKATFEIIREDNWVAAFWAAPFFEIAIDLNENPSQKALTFNSFCSILNVIG